MKDSVKFYLENRFEIIKILRQSDKGEVQLAQSKETGEFVIIKKVNFTGLPYKILKKNPHQFFAKILKCAEDTDDVVVVEEFIQGESLIERLQRKNFLTEDAAQKILLQLCDGLKFLHSLGIIHRDIKPSNLILQADGIVKLIDFDASRIVKENQSEDTNTLGTKGYAPPEQYGYGQTDSRSDIYALGITFQKLLGENYRGRLKNILSKCTELDPKNRWQSVDELKSALIRQENIPDEKNFKPIKFITATIVIFVLYNFFNANQNKPLPVEENPAPQIETPKFEEPAEIPAQIEKPVEKNFTFPEINLPPIPSSTPIVNPPAQIEQLPLPQIEIEPPNIEKPPVIDDYKTPEPFQKEIASGNADYVKAEYFLDGYRLHAWTDEFDLNFTDVKPAELYEISYNEWNAWEKVSSNSAAIKFPNSVIEVFVKNFSDKTFKNPQLEIIFDNNGRIEKKTLRGNDIAPNQTITFKIPLNQFRIDNPHYRIVNAIFDRITLNFRGDGAEIRGTNANVNFHFNQN